MISSHLHFKPFLTLIHQCFQMKTSNISAIGETSQYKECFLSLYRRFLVVTGGEYSMLIYHCNCNGVRSHFLPLPSCIQEYMTPTYLFCVKMKTDPTIIVERYMSKFNVHCLTTKTFLHKPYTSNAT